MHFLSFIKVTKAYVFGTVYSAALFLMDLSNPLALTDDVCSVEMYMFWYIADCQI